MNTITFDIGLWDKVMEAWDEPNRNSVARARRYATRHPAPYEAALVAIESVLTDYERDGEETRINTVDDIRDAFETLMFTAVLGASSLFARTIQVIANATRRIIVGDMSYEEFLDARSTPSCSTSWATSWTPSVSMSSARNRFASRPKTSPPSPARPLTW